MSNSRPRARLLWLWLPALAILAFLVMVLVVRLSERHAYRHVRRFHHHVRDSAVIPHSTRAVPLRVAVLTYENRHHLDYVPAQQRLNRAYCDRHGYNWCFQTEPSPAWPRDLPPWWIKLFALRDLLAQTRSDGLRRYELVLWLDSDAVVVRPELPLDTFLPSDHKHWVMAKDHDHSPFVSLARRQLNAGVFLVRNSPEGRASLEAVLATYSPSQWSSPTRWRVGKWAGVAFEQEQLTRHFLSPEGARHLHLVPTKVWNTPNRQRDHTFIVHGYDRKAKTKLARRFTAWADEEEEKARTANESMVT